MSDLNPSDNPAVKLTPPPGTPVKTETLKITLPPRSETAAKAPAPLIAKPPAPVSPVATVPKPPATPSAVPPPKPPQPSPAASEAFEKTIKLGSIPGLSPLPLPKSQVVSPAPAIAPKPLVGAPVPQAITEAIPVAPGVVPPPKPSAVPAPVKAPTDTRSLKQASVPVPPAGMTPQGPTSIPPKVAVPGTAPKPVAPAAPSAPKPPGAPSAPASPAALVPKPVAPGAPKPSGAPSPSVVKPSGPASIASGSKPSPSIPKHSTSSSGPESVSAPLKSGVTPAKSATPAPMAAVVTEDEEPSQVWTILAILAAVLTLAVAGYLFYAWQNNVIS